MYRNTESFRRLRFRETGAERRNVFDAVETPIGGIQEFEVRSD